MSDKPQKKRLELPKGLSYKEEAQWWDEHPEYWDQFDESEWEVHEPGPEGTKVRFPYMRLPAELADAIHKLAMTRDMTSPQLIQIWLEERLEAERKALTQKRAKPKH